ncbi:MAG: ATP synthase F1 subunit gamma [Lachnospiraceae bacterium]|nr:ATP synthase F1 subunit gamma [Lachnospiraceae bacterium]
MASAREIQSRMKSIQDTKKITSAMYMISSSKLKRVRTMLEATETHFYAIQNAIARMLRHFPDMEHPYFGHNVPEKDRKVGYLIVTADKGLAGAYNHNVLKLAQEEMEKSDIDRLYVVGEIGRHYFEHKKIEIDESFRYTVQNPSIHRARIIAGRMIALYNSGELDEIHLIYTKMLNSMESEAESYQILPLKKKEYHLDSTVEVPEDIEYLPSADAVLENLVPNYVTGLMYGALVEAYASEQNARMMAMESATDSATDMIRELSIQYNRVRQGAITQEITEVSSGAKAQKKKSR